MNTQANNIKPATTQDTVEDRAVVHRGRSAIHELQIANRDARIVELGKRLHKAEAERAELVAALKECVQRGYSPDVDNGCVQASALLARLGAE